MHRSAIQLSSTFWLTSLTVLSVGCSGGRPEFGIPSDSGAEIQEEPEGGRNATTGDAAPDQQESSDAPSTSAQDAGSAQATQGSSNPAGSSATGVSTDQLINTIISDAGSDSTTHDEPTATNESTIDSLESASTFTHVAPDSGGWTGVSDASMTDSIECGDGTVDGEEECEGTELPDLTCAAARMRPSIGTPTCSDCEIDTSECEDLDPTTGIAAVLAEPASGSVDIPIDGAFVTYVTPVFEGSVAGFFLQGEPDGPAVFVRGSGVEVGDLVSLVASELVLDEPAGTVVVTSFAGLSVHSQGYDVRNLTQEVSNKSDLTTFRSNYVSELVAADVTIAGGQAMAGPLWGSFRVVTVGMPTPSAGFTLRTPNSVAAELDLANGCTATVGPLPFIPYVENAQLNAWLAADISLTSCPAPRLLSAEAPTATSVLLDFDRSIDAETVLQDGSQFTMLGLTVSQAEVVEGNVMLTTDEQVGLQPYTVTVSETVKDKLAASVSADNNSSTFQGYERPAKVRFNEINTNITFGCDLVELRVIETGSVNGLTLTSGSDTKLTLSSRFERNDLIVVHLNSGNCNDTGALSEWAEPDEYPTSEHPANFDGAYDIYTSSTAISSSSPTVLALWNGTSVIDAVFLTTDESSIEPSSATVTAADEIADAGGWNTVDGEQPEGGYADAAFDINAVSNLAGTSTEASGLTIQRLDDADTNSLSDWTMAEQTWGSLNAGQSDL